jgi:MFS family permease
VSSRLPLYIGGFLGPFGGGVVAVLIPELELAFDASQHAVAASITAYVIPFAALQLVSGTVGERLGRRRVVFVGYCAYAVTSLASAFAPDIASFLVCRAAAGASNAFLTPLLLAGLADLVPRDRLGRSLGLFAAIQTSAFALAPLCGGLAGEVNWRLAFVVPALVGLGLAFIPPPEAPRGDGLPRPTFGSLITPRVAALAASGLTAFMGVAGLGFLVSVWAADEFGLGAAARGTLLAVFGVTGMLAGPPAGLAVDRVGPAPIIAAGSAVSAAAVGGLGLAGSDLVLATLWGLAGVGSTVVWAGLNVLIVEAVPVNRAGATSLVGAFKFAGSAASPIVLLPIYDSSAHLAFGLAAALGLLTAALAAPVGREQVPV